MQFSLLNQKLTALSCCFLPFRFLALLFLLDNNSNMFLLGLFAWILLNWIREWHECGCGKSWSLWEKLQQCSFLQRKMCLSVPPDFCINSLYVVCYLEVEVIRFVAWFQVMILIENVLSKACVFKSEIWAWKQKCSQPMFSCKKLQNAEFF